MRMQQTIRSQESCIMSYKNVNLRQFYLMTMWRTIDEALLSSTKSMFLPLSNEPVYLFNFDYII